ncbi:(2Fe-2S)-binding protein [Lignipirellula cremea]|uniref:Carbon monoxide dehydrogenase small chain n=1 Tax=Lignipirellula cremea TaxID=2528010 RepID=A0A518DTB8_9BACT|nr:(2Fe-2S)-binding protein [Lignipirellula cremea]QDU95089.1 Carbon monoxide dehydrogenase small chain [Lignipirellula cremea]
MSNWFQEHFSRRKFLGGTGAVAATALLSESARQAEAAEKEPQVRSGEQTIKLKVNGKVHEVKVEPRTTLLDVLRYQLDLTGAKPVSIDGSSGASTVIVDGKPVTASTTLALAVEGKAIQTVESLAGKKLDPVPQCFVEHDAEQCGFCTPGFVVAVRAYLDKNPNATEEMIRNNLNGNICRCGTYVNVLQAAVAVVKGGGNG